MFKHPKCGGQHETVSQARECEGRIKAVHVKLGGMVKNAEQTETIAEINADQETWPWSHRKGKDQHPFDLGRRVAEVSAEMGIDRRADLENGPGWTDPVFMAPDDEPTARTERMATDGQKSYVQALLAEHDLAGLANGASQAVEHILSDGIDILTFAAAQVIIPALKELPKKATPRAEQKEQPWRTLSREVPAGNYKITDEEGKNRFYRVSVGKNDYYKLQERASEELYFIPLKSYVGILRSILAVGVDAARLAYAMDQVRCWHCNTKLTDNVGNPHYGRGLGPKCGQEH